MIWITAIRHPLMVTFVVTILELMCSAWRNFVTREAFKTRKGLHWLVIYLQNFIGSLFSVLLRCDLRPDQTRADSTTQLRFSLNVVRCPHPNCSSHQQSMCGAPPPSSIHFCAVSPHCTVGQHMGKKKNFQHGQEYH